MRRMLFSIRRVRLTLPSSRRPGQDEEPVSSHLRNLRIVQLCETAPGQVNVSQTLHPYRLQHSEFTSAITNLKTKIGPHCLKL